MISIGVIFICEILRVRENCFVKKMLKVVIDW